MRIGIDIRLLGKQRTGDEVYFFNLVRNLSRVDEQNEYALFTDRDPEANPELAEVIEQLNLTDNFKVVIINSPNRFWWNFWALPNYLRKNPIDVFHTQYIAPFRLPKNIKLVLTIHDISFNYHPEYIKKSDLLFLKTLLPRSIRRADKVLTVSESEKKNIIDCYKIPADKIEFTHNGVDFEKFNKRISDNEKEAVRMKYKLPMEFILYIGTLQPRKNIPVLIEAVKDFSLPLVAAGNKSSHNFDPAIDCTVSKLCLNDKIIFPGWINEEDKPALLQMAKCFVFPSLYEGFGIPVIEAMSAKTPVICSDIPALREVAKDAALFADPNNPRDFSEKIHQLLDNETLRTALIQKGIELAKFYTWQKTAEKTLKIYENIE